jgi:altronate hydrolase
MVALRDLPAGHEVTSDHGTIYLQAPIPAKHKFLLVDRAAGQEVKMYGVLVGKPTRDLKAGERLTTDNLHHAAADYHLADSHYQWEAPDVSPWQNRTFEGYHRADGQVGTANYWLVVPLVFCENRNIMALKQAFEQALGYARPDPYTGLAQQLKTAHQAGQSAAELRQLSLADPVPQRDHRYFPNVDGLRFLTHTFGCGGTQQDAHDLAGLLAGYIHHPNVAGATVLSLGCQHTQVQLLQDQIARRTPELGKPLLVFEQQAYGTEAALMEAAIQETFLGLVGANQVVRAAAPLSKLRIGVECGGSDGFSGLSANPAIGQAADRLVALGGTVILSEFPELCGVEQALIDRCATPEVATQFVTLMRRYQGWAEAVGSGFDMNPSPGNIRDGLITDAIKSAGAALKGGHSPVQGVLDYPEYASTAGLNLLCTPGNDVESTTALAGAGAQIIFFSTGLGTPTGNPLASVIKVSSNHAVAERMPDIIDYDAGGIIDGSRSLSQAGSDLLDLALAVASGTQETCAERLGQHDFIPWKRGVSL